jgi:hypothetical protein
MSSCNFSYSDSTDFPPVSLPSNEMNKVIQIEELPQFRNSHKNNDCLDLHVKNLSDKTIAFHSGSDILLFTKATGEWIPVADTMQNPSEIDYLAPTNQFPPGMVISTCPNIPNMIGAQIIRIIIIGHYTDAEEKLVGSYLDKTLFP